MKKDKYSGQRMRELGLAWGGDGVPVILESRQFKRRVDRQAKKNPTLYRGYPESRHERRKETRDQAKQELREGIKAVYQSLPKPVYAGIGRGIRAGRRTPRPSRYFDGIGEKTETLISAFERLGVSTEDARQAAEQIKAHHGQVMDEPR